MRSPAPHRRRRGLSLVEVVLASTLFTGIGYVLALSMRASDQSYATVTSGVAANTEIRAFTTCMADELKGARAATVDVAQDGVHSRIEFQTAIRSDDAEPAWGAYERDLDVAEANCSQPGWNVRYRVVGGQEGGDSLVRQIVDTSGEVRHTRTLAEDVTEFTVSAVGDVWVVRLTTQGKEGIRHEEFDVRTRDR